MPTKPRYIRAKDTALPITTYQIGLQAGDTGIRSVQDILLPVTRDDSITIAYTNQDGTAGRTGTAVKKSPHKKKEK